MKTERQKKIDSFNRATPEQQRAFELVGLTAKAMNASSLEQRLAGREEAAKVIQVLAKALERAWQSGSGQHRLMAVSGVIAQLEGSARRAEESGHKKLGGCLKMFALEVRAIVAEPVKIINERPRKRRQLPLPRPGKRRQRKAAPGRETARTHARKRGLKRNHTSPIPSSNEPAAIGKQRLSRT